MLMLMRMLMLMLLFDDDGDAMVLFYVLERGRQWGKV